MIEINELDLVKFAQDVYSLSTPQGLGFLHVKEGGLSVEEATAIVNRFSGDKSIALDLDYVHGRACKMTVHRSENGGYQLSDSWYDHSNAQYSELLSRYGIKREQETPEKKASEKGLGVPYGCTLDSMIQLVIAMGGFEHPCDRCNEDRKICKGYARKEQYDY